MDHDLNSKKMWKDGECGRNDGREGLLEVLVGDFEVLIKYQPNLDRSGFRNQHLRLLLGPPLLLLTQHFHGPIVSTFSISC